MKEILTPREAVEFIRDGAALALGGFGSYCGPDALL